MKTQGNYATNEIVKISLCNIIDYALIRLICDLESGSIQQVMQVTNRNVICHLKTRIAKQAHLQGNFFFYTSTTINKPNYTLLFKK